MKVIRPQAKPGKISCKNEFENCYLRHKYVRRTTRNPGPEEMRPYEVLIQNLSYKTYNAYQNIFGVVGMQVQDIQNICRVHLVSYLGLFSTQSSEERRTRFQLRFYRLNSVEPGPEDFLNKDLADFTSFLKQRLEELVRISSQKGRNVAGTHVDSVFLFYGPKQPPKNMEKLPDHYERMGFKKANPTQKRRIMKTVDFSDSTVVLQDQTWYILYYMNRFPITEADLIGAGVGPGQTRHHSTADHLLSEHEQDQHWIQVGTEFNKQEESEKIRILMSFIEKNQNDPDLKSQIKTARRILKETEGVIRLG